jgi:hypothetical protein
LNCTIANHSKVLQAVTRLHNFIIDNDKPQLGPIQLNADGTIDPVELERFGVEALSIGEMYGQGPLGNLGFVAYDGLEYDINEGECAQRQAIVNELEARDIRRPHCTL